MSQLLFSGSGLFKAVTSLAYDNVNGNLYAANFGDHNNSNNSNIIKIDANGIATSLTSGYNDRDFSGMIYLDGFLYVTGYNQYVYKVNVTSGFVTTFATIPGSCITVGITHWNGDLYVVCMGADKGIYKINVNSANVSIFISSQVLATLTPMYITTDSNGNFYISVDDTSPKIIKFDNSGNLINNAFITVAGKYFETIIFYNNYLYITDLNSLTGDVYKYDMNGSLIGKAGSLGSVYQGGGITFSDNGTLYLASKLGGTTVIDRIVPASTPNSNPTQPSQPISTICFPANTPITTDQGVVSIDKINPSIHTINDNKIVAITKTLSKDKYLVCFEKGSLGNNLPSKRTVMSKHHKILHNGVMVEAKKFVGDFEYITKIEYTGEVLYNVLMETHDTMSVNNLICETLDPKTSIAQLYETLSKYEVDIDERDELIEYIITKLSNINNKKSQKCIKT
jgi:hypothetical protein